MVKIIGALGAVSLGLLVVFMYLVGERQESKQEIRNASTHIEKKSLEFDKEGFMTKHFMALDFGNQEEAEYYKSKADAVALQLEKIEAQELAEKEKLEKIRKETEQFYIDTKTAAQKANDNISEEDDFYAKLKAKNDTQNGGEGL